MTMTNIAEKLRYCPIGTKLYSPLFGEVEFVESESMITVKDINGIIHMFFSDGKFCNLTDAECLLFPSKEVRTWEHWEVPVEPKFKVGDWIVKYDEFGVMIRLVDKLLSKSYLLLDKFGVKYNISFYQQDRWRLWTIEDAKDGDVLVSGHELPFIYAGNKKCACYVDYKHIFHIGDNRWFFNERTQPATKEQRDFLFAKMKEAGWELDAEKKEFKKIKSHYDISNFKPFDKVLVRNMNTQSWRCGLYSHYIDGKEWPFMVNDSSYKHCIPYEGNEHLLGTTDLCDECYINW